MKKPNDLLLMGVVISMSFIFALIGYIFLPDTLIAQITISGEGATLPKIIGLAIPFLISVIASFAYYKQKNLTKYIITILICTVIYILIFIFNI